MERGPRPHKSIFDPVHGIVDLDGVSLDLISDPAFQRLWGVRQTGFAHLVFPGANHTRLEHSLGVYWVAGAMGRALGLTGPALETVRAGALLHDIGHGPFSHTLDASMEEVLGHGHEVASRRLIVGDAGGDSPTLPRILERHQLKPREVAGLIDPTGPGASSGAIARSILHGAIDADRIDYLQRDAHYTGVAHGAIDAVRLLATVRPRAGRIVYAEKGRSAVEGFIVGRALMYASVYYHKTVRAAEVMAQAAVERLSGYPETARPLFRSTDGALLVDLSSAGGRTADLVGRLLRRDLYKRALALRSLTADRRRAFARLQRDPRRRRAWEDRTSARLGAPPASVLLDLAGLEARESDGPGWPDVAVEEEGRLTYPFRHEEPWSSFLARPPSLFAVSIYVAPRYRRRAAALFAQDRSLPD